MGALTLKSFPFELRGWDIEKFESIDPTDGFGTNTRVSKSKNQIIQIEPDYDIYNLNTWLTDKGRQFFDGIFETWSLKNKNEPWSKLLNKIIKSIYIFDHCNKQNSKNYFFTIVFHNLSLEILNILVFLSQNYSFIKLRKIEDLKLDNGLESNFQLNTSSNIIKLNYSSLCLLISTNPRYEGYYLNLNLRQRILKGNFKCLIVGSLINLTFPTLFLGSNFNIIKTVTEGNNFICQDLKFSKNPILVYNNELSKRNSNKNIIETFKTLCYSNIFNKTWNGFNILNPSLSDNGILALKQIPKLSSTDLNNFSSLYFLNIATNNISNLKRITELKLTKEFLNNKLVIDQNYKINNNITFSNKISSNYLYLPTNTFYENEETYINTEGFIKKTTKIISRKENKNSWQILRKFIKHFKNKLTFFNRKNNQIIIFNSQKYQNFRNFISFHYYATQTLNNLSFNLNIKNKPFIYNKAFLNFKLKSQKFNNTKLKYWLDDFFISGKDEYSQNSLILTNCSKILRLETTNFF